MRPMGVGEVIDSALRLYQRRGADILASTVLPSVATLASAIFVLSEVLPRLFTTKNPDDVIRQLGETTIALLMGLFLGCPLALIGIAYTTTIAVKITSDEYLGNRVDPDAAQELGRSQLKSMFKLCLRQLLQALAGVIVSLVLLLIGGLISEKGGSADWLGGIAVALGILGLFFGFIYFVYVVARDSLAYPAMVVEGADWKSAAKRSRELLRYHPDHGNGVGNLLATVFLVVFMLFAVGVGLSACQRMLPFLRDFADSLTALPFGQLFSTAYRLLPGLLLIWLIVPLWSTVVTLIYYDRRIRIEGFDIETLSKEIGRGRANRFDV